MSDVLVINPGSTTTKVAIYADDALLAEETIDHSVDELAKFSGIIPQKEFRKKAIEGFILTSGYHGKFDAIVGRGGLLKPIPGGTFEVDEAMLRDLTEERYNTHASNLGAILANEFAEDYQVQAYIVDPVVVDELQPVARISGLKGIERRSVGHVLNQKATARFVLNQNQKDYQNSNVIVAHLGGGISIGAHRQGKIIDMVNGLDGEGPYTPERTGGLPLVDFAEKIVTEQLKMPQIKKILAGQGGLNSYLHEIDLRKIETEMLSGDQEAAYYWEGMCYQIQKTIGEMAAVLEGRIDFIILTGGMAHSERLTKRIASHVSWIAPVEIVPGAMEMQALFEGVKRVLTGEEAAQRYETEEVSKVW